MTGCVCMKVILVSPLIVTNAGNVCLGRGAGELLGVPAICNLSLVSTLMKIPSYVLEVEDLGLDTVVARYCLR